jgi:TMEM175 potassium channel family protein
VDESIGTARVEAFSDGVFAIAVTLLILDVTVDAQRPLGHQLTHIWPSCIAYVTSFLTIGIIWLNHHSIFAKVSHADRTLLLLNALSLMVVAFLPFPTRVVADYLRRDGERGAVVAYGLTMVLMALMFQLLRRYVSGGRRLILDDVPQADGRHHARLPAGAAAVRGCDLARARQPAGVRGRLPRARDVLLAAARVVQAHQVNPRGSTVI